MRCPSPAEKGDVVTFSSWAEEQLTQALTEDIPEGQITQFSRCRKWSYIS